LKKIGEGLLMSKRELASKAGVLPLTIDRIEKGGKEKTRGSSDPRELPL